MKQDRIKLSLPTLRERERYIKFKVISSEPIVYSDLEPAVWNQLLDFYGEQGISKTSVWMIKNMWDEKEQTGVIRCNNTSVEKIIAGLALVARLGDCRVVFKILKISGTLKGLN